MQQVTNAHVNPICAACKENIGDMSIDIYLAAVEARGEYLFCPDCRTHKCDVCGWFIPTQTMTPKYDGSVFLGNCCESCNTWVLPLSDVWAEKFPYFRTMEKPNLKRIAFSSGLPALSYANEPDYAQSFEAE